MAWRGDVAGFIRGLESIRRALGEYQGREWQRMWVNSSLRSAVQQARSSAPDINPEQFQVRQPNIDRVYCRLFLICLFFMQIFAYSCLSYKG